MKKQNLTVGQLLEMIDGLHPDTEIEIEAFNAPLISYLTNMYFDGEKVVLSQYEAPDNEIEEAHEHDLDAPDDSEIIDMMKINRVR